MSNELPIGSPDAAKFLGTLFPEGAQGFVEVRAIRRGNVVVQDFLPMESAGWAYGRWRGVAETADVYVGVAPRSREEGNRSAVKSAHVIWADIDHADASKMLEEFPLAPSLVVASGSPGHRHAYWALTEPVTGETAEHLNRALALRVDGDSAATGAARVMRLPGTYNFKHEPAVKATAVSAEARRYSVDELEGAVGSSMEAASPGTDGLCEGPVRLVLERLKGVKESGNGWTALCPAHEDRRPSLSVAEGQDGRCLLHCFAGCSFEAIIHALGLQASDLFPDSDSVKALLVQLANNEGVHLFHDPKGRPFARVPVDGHEEVWPVGSRTFARWLRHRLHVTHGKVAASGAIADAVDSLSAEAEFAGPEEEVYVRVAPAKDGSLVALGDDGWGVVHVNGGGWKLLDKSPVHFIRSDATEALPRPVSGGSIEELRKFVNTPEEPAWRLLLAYIVMALQPNGPFPILILQGEKGSAKSTTARVVRNLVDPAQAGLRSGSPTERDLMINASRNWIVGFDNLSRIRERLADALCQLSTGAGFGTRALYTDEEEIVFTATRPILLNGIAALATRPDLLSRSVVIELPRLEEAKVQAESEFWQEFEQRSPRIMGALLDALAGALKLLPEVQLDEAPRMADFARLGVALEETLGWSDGSFLSAYHEQESAALGATLDSEPLAAGLLDFMSEKAEWTGTATELYEGITKKAGEEVTRKRSWPGDAGAMSRKLKELLPAIREAGVEIDRGSTGRGAKKKRVVRVCWVDGGHGDAGDAGDG